MKNQISSRTIFDAYNSASYFPTAPEIGFGTGSRPPLSNPTSTPGPGSYVIKTTMGKVIESHIKSPCQFSIRTRTKFGDPNEKALSKSNASEPGPGQYPTQGKFLYGKDPRNIVFPKTVFNSTKQTMSPGPGAYGTWGSMGHQLLSTKKEAPQVGFAKGERGGLVPPGIIDVGPFDYEPPKAACEPQIDSRKKTCGTVKIGTGYKKGMKVLKGDFSDPLPGPGSYKLPPAIGGKDSIRISLSGRNAFGSPFGFGK